MTLLPSRRRFLQTSLGGLGALMAVQPGRTAVGRTTDKVRLGWASGMLSGIAKERGELERFLALDGIAVEWQGPFPSHGPSIQAVIGGSADFSFNGSTSVAMAAILAGSPLVFSQISAVTPGPTAIIAREGAGINRLEDLIGRSVAANRSGLGEVVLIAALEKRNIDPAGVRIVYLSPPDAAAALASGKVDAWSIWSPFSYIFEEQYGARELFTDSELDFEIDFPGLVTSRAFSEANGDLVRAVNAAYAAEIKWQKENPREAQRILQRMGRYSDGVRDRLVVSQPNFRVLDLHDPAVLAHLQKAADWLTAHKMLSGPIAVAGHIAATI